MRGPGGPCPPPGPPSHGPPAFRAWFAPRGDFTARLAGVKCLERAAPHDSRGAEAQGCSPPRKTPPRQGSPWRRGAGEDPALRFLGNLQSGRWDQPPLCSYRETEARDGRRPTPLSPVPEYSPARKLAARGAATPSGLRARRKVAREEPDSPGLREAAGTSGRCQLPPERASAAHRAERGGSGGGATGPAPFLTRLGGRGAGSAH